MSKRSKVLHKVAAYIILNNWYKIVLFHPIVWRWMYYVNEYTSDQLLPIIIEGKKIQVQAFSLGIKRWIALLTRYINDGAVPIDNNGGEPDSSSTGDA